MQAKGQTSKAYFSVLTILHAALLSVQVFFALAIYYLYVTAQIQPTRAAQSLDEIFQFIVPVFMITSYVGGSLFYKIQLKALKTKTDLKEKLGHYRGTLLIKFATLEIPALFSIVCFLLTSNYLYLAGAGLMIIVFMINRPTRSSVAHDLELNPSERTMLEDPASVVM